MKSRVAPFRFPTVLFGLLVFVGACPESEEEHEKSGSEGKGEGSFTGDEDVIGTWDVTIDFDGDELGCVAKIEDDLAFAVTCEPGLGEYDVDCEETASTLNVTGSIEAGSGEIKVDQISRYPGSGCASAGVPVDRNVEQTEADGELTRTEAGVGTLGGKWSTKFYEWECAEDNCDNASRARGTDDYTDCAFELKSDGSIAISCTDVDLVEEEDWDCESTLLIDGTIGSGQLDVVLSERETGADCEGDEGDGGTIRAVRR